MNKYRAITGVNAPVDEKEANRIAAAIKAGKPLSQEERKMQYTEPGDIIPFVPAVSVPWLLEQGLIEEVKG
jgi:hypothetical protein